MRFTILDRYMLTELGGPFVFGLSAFMLIFAATEILNIGKLVSNEHAPLWARAHRSSSGRCRPTSCS